MSDDEKKPVYTLLDLRRMTKCPDEKCDFNHEYALQCWHCSGVSMTSIFRTQDNFIEMNCRKCGKIAWKLEIESGEVK